MRKLRLLFTVLCFAASLALHAQASYSITRGERPAVDLTLLGSESYTSGRFLIKIKPETQSMLTDVTRFAGDAGFVETGIQSMDQLNELFGVQAYLPYFAGLYQTNSKAYENRERHEAWGFHLWFELLCDPGTDIVNAVRHYATLAEIEVAEPIYKKELIGSHEPDGYLMRSEYSTDAISGWFPDDPQFSAQWHYHNTGQSGGTPGSDISLTDAWLIETGNQNLIVAVVDGGIDYNHPDLAANMWDQIGYNFVHNSSNVIPHDHGTHVAGTVAAVNDNGIGVSGVAGGSGTGDGVRLMSCQVFTSASNGGFHLAPVYAADNGAAISQNSWGYSMDGVYEQPVLDAIDYFNAHGGGEAMEGGITIFSAGNSGTPGQRYPACYSGAFSVAATNNQDQKSWYSTYDFWVDISAPGGETHIVTQRGVLSTLTGNSYGYYQGTSMAAPHCSGVAALIISAAYGSIDAENLAEILRSTADDHYAQNPSYIGQLGTGRLNALNALLYLGVGNAPQNLTAFPENESVFLQWDEPEPDTLMLLGYNIYRNNELVNPEPHALTMFSDINLINHQSYSYFVKAVFENSESLRSNIVQATPNTGYAGGNGTIFDPFLIETAEQLFNVRFLPDSNFLQTANIDLSIYSCDENGGWLPIGNSIRSFTGSFNGNGFRILNLCINRPTDNFTGLFGIAEDAEIKDLGLLDVHIAGNDYTAALAGHLISSSITRSFATGLIAGSSFVGGIAGTLTESSINDSYSVCNVSGNSKVGGLTGFSNNGVINNCYSTGYVSGSNLTGGLIGDSENSIINNSYWNYETSAQPASSGGEPLSTAEMVLSESFINWDFNSIWKINQSSTYPYHAWQVQAEPYNYPPQFLPPSMLLAQAVDNLIQLSWNQPSMGSPSGYNIYRNGEKINEGAPVAENIYYDADIEGFTIYTYTLTAVYDHGESMHSNKAQSMVLGFAGGSGTIEDPYLIATAYQLDAVRLFPDKHYRQIADIDLGVAPWNEGEGWEPIGTINNSFKGSYNGSGHSINNLTSNRPSKNDIGLFGVIESGNIKNLTIINPVISGRWRVGSLAGLIRYESYIEYIKVINANINVTVYSAGGLAGSLYESTAYRCYSSGQITRGSLNDWNHNGGLIGTFGLSQSSASNALIEECFSTVNISSEAHNNNGGLIGTLWYKGTVKNCYARGSVTATNAFAGGLISEISSQSGIKEIRNSYSTGQVNAPGVYVNGFLGMNSGGTFSGNFFDIETSGKPASDLAASGRTTAQMKTASTFINAGWDFDEIWTMDPQGDINDGYPVLKWAWLEDQCKRPKNLSVSEITAHTANAVWENGADEIQWDLIWGLQGFDPNTQGNLEGGLTATAFSFTGLDEGTAYDFYVRSICDENTKSYWAGPVGFKSVKMFNLEGGGSYCTGSEPTGISIVLDGSEIGYTYQLHLNNNVFGPVVSGTGNSLIWANMISGTYTVYAQSASGADWMNGSISITEIPLPFVSLTFARDTVCFDTFPFILSGGEPAGGEYHGNGVVQNILFPELAGLGQHMIYYTVIGGNGCAATVSIQITIDECIGIPELELEKAVEIFPNPVNKTLYIRISNPSLKLETVRVFNALGSLLAEHPAIPPNNMIKLDMSALPRGYHLLQLLFTDEVLVKPVILQ